MEYREYMTDRCDNLAAILDIRFLLFVLQYLAGNWSPDWSTLLHSPLGLTREKVWKLLQKRPEFSDYKLDPKRLSQHDAIVVQKMTEMFMYEEEVNNTLTTVHSVHLDQKSNITLIPHSKPKKHSKDTAKVKETNSKSQNVSQNVKEQSVSKLEAQHSSLPSHTDGVDDSNFKSPNKFELAAIDDHKVEKEKDTEQDSSKNLASKSLLESNMKNASSVSNPDTSVSISKKSDKEHSSKTTRVKDKSVKE